MVTILNQHNMLMEQNESRFSATQAITTVNNGTPICIIHSIKRGVRGIL